MIVAVLGRSRWEWGEGDVMVIRVDGRYFAQCEQGDEVCEADEIEPVLAMELLASRPGIRLTEAGRVWMSEQRELWAKFEIAERRKKAGGVR